MGKSLSSDSARVVRRSSKKKRRDVQRRTRGSASLPALAERLGPIISTVHTNDSTLTRNKGLLVSPLLELFLDRSDYGPLINRNRSIRTANPCVVSLAPVLRCCNSGFNYITDRFRGMGCAEE